MRRVAITGLQTGQTLDGPLYDRNRRLLLAPGHELTPDMVGGLIDTGVRYAYLGEWNPDDLVDDAAADGFVQSGPMEARAALADQFAQELKTAVEKALSAETDLQVLPAGKALSLSMNSAVQKERKEARIQEWKDIDNQTFELMDGVLSGNEDQAETVDKAETLIEKVLYAITNDCSLLLNLANLKDDASYLTRHSVNVAILATNIATSMKYSEAQVKEIGLGALMADIGMAMVPRQLVEAKRKLTREEFVDIQKHSIHALYALQQYPGLPLTAQFIAYQNHERIDGSGYPRRKQKTSVHRFAQIVSVADAFDALTTARPWRLAYHPYRAMEYIIRQAADRKFAGDVVRGLLHSVSLYPLGTLVVLTNGEIARVVHANRAEIDRPAVSVLIDAAGSSLSSPKLIDLAVERDVAVKSVVEKPIKLGWELGF